MNLQLTEKERLTATFWQHCGDVLHAAVGGLGECLVDLKDALVELWRPLWRTFFILCILVWAPLTVPFLGFCAWYNRLPRPSKK